MPPTGVQTTRRVPADKVAEVEAGYLADNPIKVEKKENPDGTFDVIATFPN